MTATEARQIVATAAAELDAKLPDWPSRIDVGNLKLSSGDRCIMGQLSKPGVGGWACLLNQYHLNYEVLRPAVFRWTSMNEYDVLQDAWVEAIADRLVTPEVLIEPVHVRELVTA